MAIAIAIPIPIWASDSADGLADDRARKAECRLFMYNSRKEFRSKLMSWMSTLCYGGERLE